MQKLSNKQSAKVICRFDRLRTAHSKRQKAIEALENLSSTHAFDHIVLRINAGLTSCEDLATALCTYMYVYNYSKSFEQCNNRKILI